MTTKSIARTLTAIAVTLAATATTIMLASASSQKFYADDPVWVERDTQDASRMTPLEPSLFVDLSYNVIQGFKTVAPARAGNVNTVDEVPDSSWFTNRIGHRPLTTDDVANGPNTGDGPAPGTWTITSSKSDGVTPGFTVKDVNGQRWFLKFDPPGYRAMATGTEVAVTKLMWALGYNVPENHIAYMRREQLVVGDTAKYTPVSGKTRAMRLNDLDALLERASREPNGSYRVVASKALPGKPIGRIKFEGTRPDDPNDLVPHEDRRELRGYGVFAAWFNHVDAKSINSLDVLVVENGRAVVRHNIIDFGSALGSGGVGPAEYWEGAGYVLEPRDVVKQMRAFGFYFPKWRTASFYEAPAIGRLPLNNADFNPEQWRPSFPNPAFLHARADDKFWAARKLMALRTDLLRAAVRSGEFGDEASEEFLVRALAERRDAIGRAYLTAVNPIVDPVLAANGELTFLNAAVEADVAHVPQGYRAAWFRFDNVTGATDCIGESTGRTTELQAPAGLPEHNGAFIKVTLSAVSAEHPSWSVPVQAYFQRHDGGW